MIGCECVNCVMSRANERQGQMIKDLSNQRDVLTAQVTELERRLLEESSMSVWQRIWRKSQ